jgi:hypothetical protein
VYREKNVGKNTVYVDKRETVEELEMAQIIMKSWIVGLKKVSLAKLQTELLNISLKEAHKNVCLLLDDNEIILNIEDENIALNFYQKAEEIGVNCVLN